MTTEPLAAYSNQQAIQMVTDLVVAARARGGSFDIQDGATGAVVATVVAHDLPTRPKDMPRRLRPKQRLSKRQRTQAKHAKSPT